MITDREECKRWLEQAEKTLRALKGINKPQRKP
jgi:hypothetical protein